jgi:hypothetical protein
MTVNNSNNINKTNSHPVWQYLYKQWRSTILTISTKRTITSHLKLLNIKRPRHMILEIQTLACKKYKNMAEFTKYNLVTYNQMVIHIILLISFRQGIFLRFDWFLVFNATFSNISAISWRPVLVVEEAGVPGENHRPW